MDYFMHSNFVNGYLFDNKAFKESLSFEDQL
jgi:hypothetical protein